MKNGKKQEEKRRRDTNKTSHIKTKEGDLHTEKKGETKTREGRSNQKSNR